MNPLVNLYDKYVLPRIIRHVCGAGSIWKQRKRIVPEAQGAVLEIGVGPGFNIELYDPAQVRSLVTVDPSDGLLPDARLRAEASGIPTEFIQGSAESLPMGNASIDTIVITYAMCTIPDVVQALNEMRRVLKADGRLLFVEHGLAPDIAVQKWQRRINPFWSRLGGGCQLNRNIPALISEAGFAVDLVDQSYQPGYQFANYEYVGRARRR